MQIDEFIAEVIATAACFRQEDGVEGNNRLVSLIDSLSTLLLDAPPAAVLQVNQLLAVMLAAMERQEYQQLADMLEQELPQLLIAPRLPAMREQYKSNLELLQHSGYQGQIPACDDLPFWLIDNGFGDKLILYHKQKGLIGIEITQTPAAELPVPLTASDEFADYLIADQWDWSQLVPLFTAIRQKGKKAYLIPDDPGRFFSCLQGVRITPEQLEDVTLFDSMDSFKAFFKETDAYLPRNIIAHPDQSSLWQKAVAEVHQYRITPDGRKGTNVLLTIGIPSYNRGHRALASVLHHLTSQYDEEIEIVLSNNGTSNETADDYEQISRLDDARLVYFAFFENQGVALNVCKVCELSSGRFFVLMSDEDQVNLKALPGILNILEQQKDLAALRTSSKSGGKAPSLNRCAAGKEALLAFMLTSNYISGPIFNTNLVKGKNALEYVGQHAEDNPTCFIYPHMVWELLIAQYGAIKGTEIELVVEGKAEKPDFGDAVIGKEKQLTIATYATLESRLAQHEGFLRVFLDMKMFQDEPDFLRVLYQKLCWKTLFLVHLSFRAYYTKTDVRLKELLDSAHQQCLEKLDDLYQTFYQDDSQKKSAYIKKNMKKDKADIAKIYSYFNS